MKRLKIHATGLGVALALATGAALTGCAAAGANSSPTPTTAPSAAAPSPEQEPPTPEETTPSEPEVPEYSQVVDGVVYEGTEIAPVRIGDDTPGMPPAAEASLVRSNSEELAVASNKYLVYVFASAENQGRGIWKVFGVSRFGSFRQLYMAPLTASVEEALAAPKELDGRVLDRSEYLLFVEP